ncbi:MAG: M64 family metallopeptidase [bacterium]|nr:M64 family metallo-endopeptidase [candidate division KSB1 bacterium]MDH7561634.1 M64 family metallopeptidase [bacterium]
MCTRVIVVLSSLLFLVSVGSGQVAPTFEQFFIDKALRVELCQVGDAHEEFITVHRLCEEPTWPETRTQLLDPFNNGRYTVKLYDVASNCLIYSRGFDCMFGEYKTTTPALQHTKRVFQRALRVPYPKYPVLLAIEARDKQNAPDVLFTTFIDPNDYHIVRESAPGDAEVYEAHVVGPPQGAVDLVFVAEGYTAAERDKFTKDVDRFIGYLFATPPYAEHTDKINVRGLFKPSPESGMDEPRQGSFKRTAFNASFNAFDLDRYMLTEENWQLRATASQVPYDAIVVLVNSVRYGGGGIYNDYCITTVDNPASKRVFLHELGHSFAGLADEYYASEVAYNEFYPPGVEPLEPNITAFLNPELLKWKDLVSPGLPLPTDWGKERLDSLQAERQKANRAMAQELEHASKSGASQAQLDKIRAKYRKTTTRLDAQIEEVRKEHAHLRDKVGVFEGAGYASKGLYRPMVYCLMISSPDDQFCRVCQRAISRMISYYSAQ